MKKNYQKEYIEISTEFRKSNQSNESIGKLYDLLEEIKQIERTNIEEEILSNIYSLLGFHLTASEIYNKLFDPNNKKNIKKKYILEEKAKSHGNNFIIKDIREFCDKIEPINLSIEDFEVDEEDEQKFLIEKDIVIFNKVVESENFELWIYGDNTFEDNITKIVEYINWLHNCKKELIDFYNLKQSEHTEHTADKDWFDTLEIYSLRVIIGENGKLYAEISGGDEFVPDHILDIEIEEKNIIEMRYDG